MTSLFLVFAAHASEEAKRVYNVHGGDALTALREFSEACGCDILFAAETVRGVRTNPVQGEFAPLAALNQMLAGTNLSGLQDERTGALAVRKLSSANPATTQSTARTAADAHTSTSSSETTNAMNSKSKSVLLALFGWVAGTTAQVSSPGQAVAAGTIEGRVLNVTNGTYLGNARVTIEGTQLESFTDAYGGFRVIGVPAGNARVKVSYTGLPPVEETVAVQAGQVTTRDFSLTASAQPMPTDGSPLKLDPFLVTSTRETNGSNIAINEQRYAANVKNVVASDAFGDVTEGNVGELMKFLPGVTVDYVAADVRAISVRGLGANFTGVSQDGARLASGETSRTFQLEQVSINNISRVEVTKVPTPEMPADSMGGSVNMISKSAFEYARTQFKYKAYLSMNSNERQIFKKTRGPDDGDSYKVLPGVDFNYIAPLTPNLGLVINGLSSNQFNAQNEEVATWRFTGSGATPTAPYLRQYSYQPGPKNSYRDSISIKVDWRPAKDHVLSVGTQANYYHAFFDDRLFNFDIGSSDVPTPATGAPLTFGPDFTHGATGRGVVSQGRYSYDKYGMLNSGNASYRYTGRVWEIDSSLSASKSRTWYRDTGRGHMFDTQVTLNGVSRLFYDGIAESFPGKITALDAAGREIDIGNLNNYTLTTVATGPRDYIDTFKTGQLNLKRRLDFLPFDASLKIGGLRQQQTRDINRQDSALTFVGPDHLPNTADDNAGRYLDPKSVGEPNKYGIQKFEYPNIFALSDLLKSNPDYFSRTTAQAVAAEQSRIVRSMLLKEKVTAAYVQGEAHGWENRLRIVGGVRYEKTDDRGNGPLFDPSAVFQRDASGKFRTDSAGALLRKPEVGAVGSLEELALIRKLRGATTDNSYDGYFPSLHTTINLTENLLLRAAYAKTFGRPDLGNIIPNTTVSENQSANPVPGSSPGTITVVNGGLLPYTAKNYDLSLEYYFPKGGLVSVGAFKKDLTNFFGSLNTTATPELLNELSLDQRYVGWNLRSTINVAEAARVTGVEFNYVQPLALLVPNWGKYFNFTTNVTQLHLQGPRATNFDGFLPKSGNIGLTFSKNPVVVIFKWNYRGRQRLNTTSSAPNAFDYFDSRVNVDINAEYQFTRHITAFVNVRNLFNIPQFKERYSLETPVYSHRMTQSEFGAQWAFGVKGSF